MFKFDFQLEEDDRDDSVTSPATGPPTKSNGIRTNAEAGPSKPRREDPCRHISLSELLDELPEQISYTPISVPGVSPPLLRRDLFDVRYQLVSQTEEDETSLTGHHTDQPASRGSDIVPNVNGLLVSNGNANTSGAAEANVDYVDSVTDLIPGLYEGGLKTWEGGVDLVETLSGVNSDQFSLGEYASNTKILEVGCGTALPSAYILRSILADGAAGKTTLHMQDYNLPVLTLVTLPNLLLTALPYLPPDLLRAAEEVTDVEDTLPSLDQPGILQITQELKDGFCTLLRERSVELRFSYGSWSGLAQDLEAEGERYGMVLTAETIYSEESVGDLIGVLKASSMGSIHTVATAVAPATGEKTASIDPGNLPVGIEGGLNGLSVKDAWSSEPLKEQEGTVILVAAKVLYFGVGGGLQAFLHLIEELGGSHETVRTWSQGVGRSVVQFKWP